MRWACSLLLVGCTQFTGPSPVVCIDPALPALWAEDAVEATELWKDDSGGLVAPQPVIADPSEERCEVDLRWGIPSSGASARTEVDLGRAPRIRVWFERIRPEERVTAIAHELGHAMGAGHSKRPADLMYYMVEGQKRATTRDIEAVLE
jgi:hypothetical protein